MLVEEAHFLGRRRQKVKVSLNKAIVLDRRAVDNSIREASKPIDAFWIWLSGLRHIPYRFTITCISNMRRTDLFFTNSHVMDLRPKIQPDLSLSSKFNSEEFFGRTKKTKFCFLFLNASFLIVFTILIKPKHF